jgi:hypothetical protein
MSQRWARGHLSDVADISEMTTVGITQTVNTKTEHGSCMFIMTMITTLWLLRDGYSVVIWKAHSGYTPNTQLKIQRYNMSDLTMCQNAECPMKRRCKRFIDMPSFPYQSYAMFNFAEVQGVTTCEDFIDGSDLIKYREETEARLGSQKEAPNTRGSI